jgi:Phage portal protein, SPP1 Gp6-like
VAVVIPLRTDAADPFLDELERTRDRLLRKLRVQRRHGSALWAWYHGEQPAPVVSAQYRPAYRLFLELARTPWARLVVDAIAERLRVDGFRAGAGGDAEEDAAWRLYLDSALDSDEWLVYTEALITGRGYVSVSRVGNAPPSIAPESGFEITHEAEPGNRRTVQAAIKLYPLAWGGLDFACELYRPEATYRWLTSLEKELEDGTFPIDRETDVSSLRWEEDDPFETTNPAGLVPVVPFENRATVLGGGVSELEDCIPILRRIDKLTLDKLMTSEFASFRQRWATGLEVPKDESGNPIEPYSAAVSKLWVSESSDTKFGTFDSSDLKQYLEAIDADIAALAAISRVPAHYLIQTSLANPPSAESLVAAESGLVAKVRERQRRFGNSWETAIKLAFLLGGETTFATDTTLEVVWADAEMRNPAQVADAAVKLQAIGVPRDALFEYVGATPQQIDEWSRQSAAEELAAAALAPVAPPVSAES